MHAVAAIFSMDPSRKAQLIEELDPTIITMVRELPGYVAGFWSWDHATNVSYAFMIFEHEEQARVLESTVRGMAEKNAVPGTRIERVATAEIVGAASGNAARKMDGAKLWARFGAPTTGA
jgi:hypothetical protein